MAALLPIRLSSSLSPSKHPALSPTPDCGDMADLLRTKDTTCSIIISSQVLITVFQSKQIDIPSSFDGSNGILGLCVVGRRMMDFVFPVFFLLRVVTIQVCLSAVLRQRLAKNWSSFFKHADKTHHKTAVTRSEEFFKTMPHQ